jgi:hypothetical protein
VLRRRRARPDGNDASRLSRRTERSSYPTAAVCFRHPAYCLTLTFESKSGPGRPSRFSPKLLCAGCCGCRLSAVARKRSGGFRARRESRDRNLHATRAVNSIMSKLAGGEMPQFGRQSPPHRRMALHHPAEPPGKPRRENGAASGGRDRPAPLRQSMPKVIRGRMRRRSI